MANTTKYASRIAFFLSAALLLLPLALAIFGDTIASFTPTPMGNGRGMAFDGTYLYYTLYGGSTPNTNVYKVDTAGNAIATIATNPSVECGALAWSGADLWCGSYDGSTKVYKIDPVTGTATLKFDEAAFGGIAADACVYPGIVDKYIDGLALDSDGTLWLSGDLARTIYHLNADGTLIASFSTPNYPATGSPGCNSGIEVAPGGYLELAMLNPADFSDNQLVKVPKSSPAGATIPTASNTNAEDLAYDPVTFAPKCALWVNPASAYTGPNVITAYEVQCGQSITKTIGYWKNHPADAKLPQTLGDGTDTLPGCMVVDTTSEVVAVTAGANSKDAVKMLQAQLLAAKLNVAVEDIPAADFTAIAPVIMQADNLLAKNTCNPNTGNKGADRAEATSLISQLDAFNNKYST